MIMYKVLRRTSEGLLSYGSHVATQEYDEKKWNYPGIPNSKLFVFKELEDAYSYLGCGTANNKLWECEVTDPEICEALNYWLAPEESFVRFWNNSRSVLWADTPPKGTWLVSSLKFIKRI